MTTGSSPRRRSLVPDEGGAAALIFALALPVVLGFGALVVDIGNARLVRGHMQSAADAAALAASQVLTDKTVAAERAVTYATNNVPSSYGEVAKEGMSSSASMMPAGRSSPPTHRPPMPCG